MVVSILKLKVVVVVVVVAVVVVVEEIFTVSISALVNQGQSKGGLFFSLVT